MKTNEIITTQIKHINANIKDYILISIPIIVIFTFVGTSYFDEVTEVGSNLENWLLIPFLIYAFFYIFKFFVNIHRLVILNDRSNYYSFLKFKIVFLYFFYLISLFIIGAIISLAVQYILTFVFDGTENTFLLFLIFDSEYFWDIIFWALIFPFFALILPQAATNELIGFINTVKQSKKVWLTLFLQALIIYIPIYFFSNAMEFLEVSPEFLSILIDLIINIIWAYGICLHVGCLSKTYILWKEEEKS